MLVTKNIKDEYHRVTEQEEICFDRNIIEYDP